MRTPSWAGPLTTSLRGLWVSGLLPPGNGGPNKRAATLEPTKRLRGRLGPRAGIPKRKRPKLPTDVLLSNQRGLQQYEKGRGPEDPTVRREGTREPRRRGAICCCGLSRQPPSRRTHPIRRCGVVLPSLARCGWTVAHASLLVAPLDPQNFASLQRTISGVRGRLHFLLGCGFPVPDRFV